jgi:hypothetical protein
MSGAVRSGLIFAVVGIIAVVAFSFIPLAGPFLCGPLAAALVGTAAGYYGVRWSGERAGAGQGLLAGAIAGVGTLIGAVLFFIILIGIARNTPGFEQQLRSALDQQNARVNPSDVNTIMNAIGPIAGLCFGVINLLLSLALGALGGWLAARNRARPAQPTPLEPPMPPPLSPSQ